MKDGFIAAEIREMKIKMQNLHGFKYPTKLLYHHKMYC